jgi:hypothetical protein
MFGLLRFYAEGKSRLRGRGRRSFVTGMVRTKKIDQMVRFGAFWGAGGRAAYWYSPHSAGAPNKVVVRSTIIKGAMSHEQRWQALYKAV